MRTLCDAAVPGARAPTCLVLLPPARAQPEDFLAQGFVAAVRTRQLPCDVILVEPRMQHLTDRGVLGRLRDEVVLPARRAPAAVWLAGISLGAFMALAYAERHATELAGLCLLAPYLGSHLITGEIGRAGGLARWEPGADEEEDDERRVWRFIQRAGAGLRLHLGFGAQDRFATGHELMAQVLRKESVDVVPGGHDWRTWHRLWENFLDARTV
jgi:pimeloyl-ACP methyl ester carboxylesterase